MDSYMAEEYRGIRFYHSVDEHPEPDEFSRHCHAHYEIIYVVRGAGKYVVEGAQYELRPDTLMVFRPGEFHYVNVRRGEPYERYVFHFSEEALLTGGEALRQQEERPLGEGNFYVLSEFPMAVAPLFERFSQLSFLPRPVAEQIAPFHLSELLLLLSLASPKVSKQRREEPLGARVIRYVNSHIAEPLSLDAIAGEFYVSKFYLCRAFKRHNGISVLGYINSKRVMMARQMIESGEVATVVSEKVGFSDYSTFYRAYRKAYGHAPTEARGREGREACK
ncbi:MAG: AraC family transcriptional regulator [Clostridia bacterium]|nr:AraC family transcriptional regulator [Clostridia bacterium]